MIYQVSYQMYRYEHGLSAAEQRAADDRAGEAAAALRELGLRLGRAFRQRRHQQTAQSWRAAKTLDSRQPHSRPQPCR